MDLSPNEIAEIRKDVEATARALHTAHLTRGEGSLEYFMSFCDEDVFVIGTGLEEVIESKERLQTFIEREITARTEELSLANFGALKEKIATFKAV
jgi:hypothetical protein